ncbi:MAG: DUF4129 domain-containing protein [Candidatus Thermoplasmatota archaeon]|nr:DUF4129 domain-containing protein [Candidatus Thermoplasmatota archaeon]
MRKSLVMLVLLAMIATSLFGMMENTSGRIEYTVPADQEDPLGSYGDPVQELTDPIEEVSDGLFVGPRPELSLFPEEALPVGMEDVGLDWPRNEEETRDPTRGAVNTSSLIYIQEAPKKVYYNDEVRLAGLLLEDNNSDGERNSGDYPIVNEFVKLQWADGTEFYFEADLRTEWDNQELNLTAGRFSMPSKFLGNDTDPVKMYANVTSISANPIELRLYYQGVWTVDGARFYNITQDIYNVLWDKKIGVDDDGDAALLQSNGIDDDHDGVIDDGAPGIPKSGWPEGVDEEDFEFDDQGNPIDTDGDGLIDEDPNAFIARRGYEKRLYVEIWHKTKTTIEVEGSDLIDVGDTFKVSGMIEDTSYANTIMGTKTMRLFWDGQPVAETVALPVASQYFSKYEFTFRVPDRATAGAHSVSVEFSPSYNITNNYYFDPSNATTTIHVRRPTKVIFDNVDPNYKVTWVYRGSTIWINGSIVDKLYYEREFTHEGPKLSIDGVEYGNQYRFNVMWGDPIQPFATMWTGQFIIDDNGTFSIEYDLPAGNQPLGAVTVFVETNFDESRYHDPLMYYSNSQNSTRFMVRARTELSIWIDQNKNGLDDEIEQDQYGNPLNTYITRIQFKDANGKVYDWNYARVRGRLKDLSQSSGAVRVGVPNQEIKFYWGFGKTYQKYIDLVTDSNGNFEVDIPISPNHALGPVPIRASFASDYWTNYYDTSTYVDADGQPFSVVSFTSLSINASVAVKGKDVRVTGTLLDDQLVGIGNRSIKIFRLDRWDGNYNSLSAAGGKGTFIGTATTNSIGKFSFSDYTVEERMNVGSVWVVAEFAGSEEFPDGPGGVRYRANDAYTHIISVPDKLIITSETAVVLETVPNFLVRNGEARITGKLLESYKGRYDQTRGVAGQTVTAYLKQGEEVFKMGAQRTRSDPNLPEFNGYFEIKTQNVPSKLTVGNVEIIVDFEPEISAEGVPLYQPSSNRTVAEVWSSTRVKEVYIGPDDRSDPQDGRIDLYEDHPEEWVFTYQVLEGSTEVTSGDPVTYGVVWLNITLGPYTNVTRALTDIRGRVHFNFTSRFTDTATGNMFSIPAEQENANLTIQVNFVGKQGYTSSIKTRFCTYHKEKIEPPERTPWALLFLFLFVLFLIAIVVLFFFYRYIERRRRLRALKKIIKKAADQLETGNPYSAVIFKAYQKMGAHLRRYGFMRRDADTFREFEDAVRAALPVDEGSLNNFLDILEEARYSKHVIGSGHKDRAIDCLRNVERSLDNIILDEEAALRQMELADEEYIETDIVVSEDKGA